MTTIRELLAPIRELETAATEGPWSWTDLGSQTRQELRNAERPLLRCSALMHPEPADAAFIAAARTDVPRLVAAIEAVEDLAKVWNAKGEHDMVYSKTIPDEDIAMELLTHGADMVEKARILRAAVVAALGGEA